MTFEEYSKKNNEKIYKKICEYLPWREPKEHYKIVREYTKRRGKYCRPNLALLWCELYGGKKDNIFLIACAIQVAEDWLLMHDDWMDGNELRRGKPSAHKLYGEHLTINAGDSSQMVMWKIVHDAVKKPNTEIGERLFEKFYDIMLITTEGQYYDIKLAREKEITKFTLNDYWKSIHAKAACYSVFGPMQLGAIAAGRNTTEIEEIKKYGIPIGKAFQIKDDILDCISTPKVLGKTIGNDIYEGSKTAILWHFIQHADKKSLEKVRKIYTKKREEKTLQEVKLVIRLFKKTGSVTFAEQLVDKLAEEALEQFEKHTKSIPECELKETARDAIRKMVQRRK